MSIPSMTLIVDASPKAKMDAPCMNILGVRYLRSHLIFNRGVGSLDSRERHPGQLGSSTAIGHTFFICVHTGQDERGRKGDGRHGHPFLGTRCQEQVRIQNVPCMIRLLNTFCYIMPFFADNSKAKGPWRD